MHVQTFPMSIRNEEKRVMWVPCAWFVFPFSSECTLLGPFPLPLHLNCFEWTLWWTTQSLRKNTAPAAENCARRQPSATTLLTLHRLWSHFAQNHAPFWGSPLSMTSQQKYKPDTSCQSRMTVKGRSPWGLRYDCITAQLLPLLPASFPSLPQMVIPKAFPN